nr:low temperature requirement protein A [Demequina sp. TTPB684]
MRKMVSTHATPEDHKVTTAELFFDLVYVFAFTQVTAWIAHEASPLGAAQGLTLLTVLWWTWVPYVRLGNSVRADRGLPLMGFVVTMAAVFVAGFAINGLWEAEGGTLKPLTFAAMYLVIRGVHASISAYVSRDDDRALRHLAWLAAAWLPSSALLIVGAFMSPETRLWWWIATIAADLAVSYVLDAVGRSPELRSGGHVAERYNLMLIVALGESVVAVGAAADQVELGATLLAFAVAGIALAVGLWGPYFRAVGPALEEALTSAKEKLKPAVVRDLFTYLHLPLVAGIIVAAAGVEEAIKALESDEPSGVAGTLIAVGAAVYLATLAVVMRLAGGRWSVLAVAALFVATAVWWASSLAVLALLALVAVVLGAATVFTPGRSEEEVSVVEVKE